MSILNAPSSAATSARVATTRALQVLETFRELSADMPMGEAVAFLMIALGETRDGGGLSVTELSKQGGFSLAAASRYVQALGELDRRREPGLGLVSDAVDLMERRKKILRLTPRGHRLIAKMGHFISPEN